MPVKKRHLRGRFQVNLIGTWVMMRVGPTNRAGVREETVEKVDKFIKSWLFSGEVVTPNKISKGAGVNPRSAEDYLRGIPKSVSDYAKDGYQKRVVGVRDSWGYVEGYGPTKLFYMGERIENVKNAAETFLESNLWEARTELRGGRQLIRYARLRSASEMVRPFPSH